MSAEQDLLDNLEALDGYKKGEDLRNTDRLHVAVCGDGGSGKTNLIARTCRKPLLDLDFDDRSESISGIKDVYIKTLTDVYDDQPTAWSDFEMVIGQLENAKRQDKLAFKSIALSSVTFLRKYAEHQALKDKGTMSRATLKVGQSTYIIPKDWDAVTCVQHMLETQIQRLFNLGIDIYAEFHLRQEKDKVRSTKTDPVYLDNLQVDPENLKMLLPKFNEVWRTFIDTEGAFKMQIKPDYKFGAKTALRATESIVSQDIQELINQYNNGNGVK